MKKIFALRCLVGLLILIGGFACSNDSAENEYCECNVSRIKGDTNSIVGEWKLMSSFNYFTNMGIDYSCDNIIFKFGSDGKLIITSDVSTIEEGVYSYEFEKVDGSAGERGYKFCIEGKELASVIFYGNEIRWGAIELDASQQTLVRIK